MRLLESIAISMDLSGQVASMRRKG